MQDRCSNAVDEKQSMVGLGTADSDLRERTGGPEVATAADGVSRSRAGTSGSPSRSISLPVDDGDAGGAFCASGSGARDAVMTIWSVWIGNAGMFILLLTNLPSQRDAPPRQRGPRPRGWSRPGKRTTDRGRFLTLPEVRLHSCGHSAGFSPASL